MQLEKRKARHQATSSSFILGQQQEQRYEPNKEKAHKENFGRPIQNCNGQNIWPIKDPPSNINPYTIPQGDKCYRCSKTGHK